MLSIIVYLVVELATSCVGTVDHAAKCFLLSLPRNTAHVHVVQFMHSLHILTHFHNKLMYFENCILGLDTAYLII